MSSERTAAALSLLGVLVASTVSAWQIYVAAPAAVAVRPNLADVGFVAAAASGHGMDWLYHHFPVGMMVATTSIAAVGFGLLGIAIE